MHLLKRKNFIILLLLVTVIIAIVILVYILYFSKLVAPSKVDNQATTNITREIKSIVSENTGQFNQAQAKAALDILNNAKLSDKERYEALKDIAFYFGVAYAASHDPQFRKNIITIMDYAKNNFSNLYEEEFFATGCADPECGEQKDDEFKKIEQEINESGISLEYLNTTTKNLEQAIYMPADEVDEKKYGFGLVIDQLYIQNNPLASAAAEHLKSYVEEKYSIEFKDVKIDEPALK